MEPFLKLFKYLSLMDVIFHYTIDISILITYCPNNNVNASVYLKQFFIFSLKT